MSSLHVTAAKVMPELLDLPWEKPLEDWPDSLITSLSKGVSRHVVRFIQLGSEILVVKETTLEMARKEYDLLKELGNAGAPCVQILAIISNRTTTDGKPLPSALITRHLQYSLPYRSLYSKALQPKTANRLIDAMAVLLVRLHLMGFFWGDVSLSNTLFRRDAGAFAAYMVDAETTTFHREGLSDGSRSHDLQIARTNVAGELMDLLRADQTADVDPVFLSERIELSYRALWDEITKTETINFLEQRWLVNARVRRLNQLGFDVEQMNMIVHENAQFMRIQPKVVDAGHHQRRLLRLTGIDAEENQARKLLNDLDAYTAVGRYQNEEMAAHKWQEEIYKPVINTIPRQLVKDLSEVELFHQVLKHSWLLSEHKKRDVSLPEVIDSFIRESMKRQSDVFPLTGSVAIILSPDKEEAKPPWQELV